MNLLDRIVKSEGDAIQLLVTAGYGEDCALDIVTYGNWIEGENMERLVRVWATDHAR